MTSNYRSFPSLPDSVAEIVKLVTRALAVRRDMRQELGLLRTYLFTLHLFCSSTILIDVGSKPGTYSFLEHG